MAIGQGVNWADNERHRPRLNGLPGLGRAKRDLQLGPVATACFELPARRSRWLGSGDTEHRGRPDNVEIPRWWSGARRAVFGSEGLATDARGPALGHVPLRKTQER